MSTAKQINRTAAVKRFAEKPLIRPEHNQTHVSNGNQSNVGPVFVVLEPFFFNWNPLISVQQSSYEPSAEYIKKTNMMDRSFNDRLKQVYVTSVNKVLEITQSFY